MSEEVPGSPQFPLPDTVSQAVLRELLQKVLPTPSDLEQFCVDYFPAVTATFYVGMDRSQVTTKLLSAGPDVVWQQLKLVRAAALTLINIAAMEQAVARVGMHSELPAPAGRLVLVGMLVLGSAGLLGLLVRHTNQQLPVAFDLSHPLPILQNRFRDGGEGSARPDAAAPDAAASPSNHLLNMQSSSEGVYPVSYTHLLYVGDRTTALQKLPAAMSGIDRFHVVAQSTKTEKNPALFRVNQLLRLSEVIVKDAAFLFLVATPPSNASGLTTVSFEGRGLLEFDTPPARRTIEQLFQPAHSQLSVLIGEWQHEEDGKNSPSSQDAFAIEARWNMLSLLAGLHSTLPYVHCLTKLDHGLSVALRCADGSYFLSTLESVRARLATKHPTQQRVDAVLFEDNLSMLLLDLVVSLALPADLNQLSSELPVSYTHLAGEPRDPKAVLGGTRDEDALVPLLIAGPGISPSANLTSLEPLHLQDVAPTVLGLLGVCLLYTSRCV